MIRSLTTQNLTSYPKVVPCDFWPSVVGDPFSYRCPWKYSSAKLSVEFQSVCRSIANSLNFLKATSIAYVVGVGFAVAAVNTGYSPFGCSVVCSCSSCALIQCMLDVTRHGVSFCFPLSFLLSLYRWTHMTPGLAVLLSVDVPTVRDNLVWLTHDSVVDDVSSS